MRLSSIIFLHDFLLFFISHDNDEGINRIKKEEKSDTFILKSIC